MTVNNDFTKLDEKSLIAFIEKTENQGTPDQFRAMAELDNRSLLPEKITALATAVNERIAYEMILNEELTKSEIGIHKSNFLTKETIKQIYVAQLEKHIEYKDQFRFNVWAYTTGGGTSRTRLH